MLPGVYDLSVYQGDTRSFGVFIQRDEGTQGSPDIVPVDLTGATAKAQFRYRERADLVATFDCEVVDPAAGHIVVTIPSSESSKMMRDGFWDLEVTSQDGTVRTWLRGSVKVTLEVSR